MTITMFQASVPVFVRGLKVVSTLLDKGAGYATEQGVEESALIEARLAPDMLTLAGQVQRASDSAKFGAARLTGTDAPSFADEETTFDQLKERIVKTIDYLGTFDADAFEGSEARIVTFGGSTKSSLPGDAYLLSFALPNFFFHVATAYDVLRQRGVPVGKRDYLGPFENANS